MLKGIFDGVLLAAICFVILISYNIHGDIGFVGRHSTIIIAYCIAIAVMLFTNVNRKITYTLAAPLLIVMLILMVAGFIRKS